MSEIPDSVALLHAEQTLELVALRDKNRELVKALEAVQWCATSCGECPVCGGVPWGSKSGHGMSCDIAKALSKTNAEAPCGC